MTQIMIGRPFFVSSALVSMVLVGCAPTVPAVVRDGKPQWYRVSSVHFVLESNMDDVEALQETLSELETYYSALGAIPILGKKGPEEKIVVVMFSSSLEYKWFVRDDSSGLVVGTPIGPLVIMRNRSAVFRSAVIKHELSHLFIHRFMPNTPDWLDEGLASLMETAKFEEDTNTVLFGNYSNILLRQALFVHHAPLETLTNEWVGDLKSELYGASWLLVHYLVDNHLQEFLAFEVAVSRGVPWREAWNDHIPVSIEAVYDSLSAYLRRAKFRLWRTEIQRPAADKFEVTSPSAADIYALRAALYASSGDERPKEERIALAKRDLEQALNQEPMNARARKVAAFLAPSEASAAFLAPSEASADEKCTAIRRRSPLPEADVIREVRLTKTHKESLRQCGRALENRSRQVVAARFTLTSSRTADAIELIPPTPAEPGFRACAEQTIRAWTFDLYLGARAWAQLRLPLEPSSLETKKKAGHVSNGLEKKDINDTIECHRPRFRACYEDRLLVNPDIKGQVTTDFVIDATGAVIHSAIRETTMHDSDVEACVERVFKSLVFPPPIGGGIVVVTYPHIFNTE